MQYPDYMSLTPDTDSIFPQTANRKLHRATYVMSYPAGSDLTDLLSCAPSRFRPHLVAIIATASSPSRLAPRVSGLVPMLSPCHDPLAPSLLSLCFLFSCPVSIAKSSPYSSCITHSSFAFDPLPIGYPSIPTGPARSIVVVVVYCTINPRDTQASVHYGHVR